MAENRDMENDALYTICACYNVDCFIPMRKIIISHFLVLALLSSCSSHKGESAENAAVKEVKLDTLVKPSSGESTKNTAVLPADFLALVPIDLLDRKSENVYEKFGLEFSGNCYSCDLASLSVAQHKIIWTNVCDDADNFEIDDFSSKKEAEKIILKTVERTFIITKIDEAPVYELLIEGRNLELTNKRIATYFTSKEALPRFKEHDCGDFDG